MFAGLVIAIHCLMNKRRFLVALALAAGCGGVDSSLDSDAMEEGPDAGDADITGPTIVSISPESGSSGVAPDTAIVVTFSEPMDQESIVSGWVSKHIPAQDADFQWNAAGDILTVIPNGPLPVAEGSGLDPRATPAIETTILVRAPVRDLAGNTLAGDGTTNFTTYRRFTADLVAIRR